MTTLAKLFAVDLRSLALLRIGIAAFILVDLADRAVFMRAHYTDFGIFTRYDAVRNQQDAQWSLHLMAGTESGQAILFLVAAVFAVLLLLGWRTRLVAVVSWVLLISLQARTPPLSYGADGVLRALLFYSMFLPVGARWSIDEIRASARGLPLLPDAHRSIASAALLLQIVIIYVFTGALKLGDPSWLRLEAVFYALAGDHHATQIGLFLAQFPVVTQALSLLTLLLEVAAPFLLFVPIGQARIRVALVLSFCAFHILTALTIHLGFFPWVSCLAWLALLPAAAWERAGVATRGVGDVAPGRHGRSAALVHTVQTGLVTAGVSLAFLSSLDNSLPGWERPRPLRALSLATSLEQRWTMFTKPMNDGWFIVAAQPAIPAGAPPIDILRRGAPLTYQRPAVIAQQFKSMRWRKYFTDMTFERATSKRNRRLFLRYLCRAWNAAAEEDSEYITRVDLVFMQVDDIPARDGAGTSEQPVRKRVLASRPCLRDRSPNRDSDPYFEMKPGGADREALAPDDGDEEDDEENDEENDEDEENDGGVQSDQRAKP